MHNKFYSCYWDFCMGNKTGMELNASKVEIPPIGG